MPCYPVIVQASPEEILSIQSTKDCILHKLEKHRSVSDIIIALPKVNRWKDAIDKVKNWGFKVYVGDAYNVCERILNASKKVDNKEFSVRVLAIWRHVDLNYVDEIVKKFLETKSELCVPPLDYDITMSADVASLDAIKKVNQLEGSSQEINRAKFNPWGYIEMHQEIFNVCYMEYAPKYQKEKVNKILNDKRMYPENEFFGREYSGSRYHFVQRFVPENSAVLDVACGSGQGAELISHKAGLVVGVDYLYEYIDIAKKRYKESDRLKFEKGDGQTFLYKNKTEQFDVVVSLHTLEHVSNDKLMLENLYRNLKKGGLLILEVPLLRKRPLGVPINPYHVKEYAVEGIVDLVKNVGFSIIRIIGSSRSFYTEDLNKTRDAIQIHARKI